MASLAVSTRDAGDSDAEAISAIYGHHVRHGTATFDTVSPTADDWRGRIRAIRLHGPFLVAVRDDSIVGYAYAARFRDRAAYAETCENSIYLAPDQTGRGIGTHLLTALLRQSHVAGFRQMIAVVGGVEPASMALHEKCGFVQVGRLKDVGFKFGRLLDTVYLQRAITA